MIIYSHDFSADPNLIPAPGRHPYYIVAPFYTPVSAGVKALHVLCHCLNNIGQSAFLLLIEPNWFGLNTNPELTTPELTWPIADYHFQEQMTPIVVYPEIISGNLKNAPVCVRFCLNFPGLLGGDQTFPKEEICFGYSRVLAEAIGAPDNILFIPVSNTRIFHPRGNEKREHVCFYAGKYRAAHNDTAFSHPPEAIEIFRDPARAQRTEEVADLFRRSKLFYCYENSALALEATLCGCPAVFMPSEYLSTPIAIEELGWDGIAWGQDPAEIERAKRTVGNAYANYVKNIPIFWEQLAHFIKITQERATRTEYKHIVQLPRHLRPSIRIPTKFRNMAIWISAGLHVLQSKGPVALVRSILRFFARRL